MPLKQSLKALITSLPSPLLKYLILAKLIVQNRLAISKSKTDWVCTLGEFDPHQRAQYARDVFNDYFYYSKISTESLSGKHVLEIGPGEHFGVALLCLAHGALKVTCLDRFPSLLPEKEQLLVYKTLVEELNEKGIETDSFIKISASDFQISADRFEHLANLPIEELQTKQKFDFILSRAVLEHVYDLDLSIAAMDRVLNAGGTMVHEVDFRDHAIFTSYGLNPLTFLMFSDSVWKTATNNLGAPNRKLENSFRTLLTKYGYDYRILKILAVGSDKKFHVERLQEGLTHDQKQTELIHSTRAKLSAEYKNIPEQDLLTSGIFFTATKLK